MKLICYLSNGYPSIEDSARVAGFYVQGGCDIIEVDLPSRNPYLESEYIAGRMTQALQACDNYEAYMGNISSLKRKFQQTKFIILTYENTVKEIGTDRFIQFCVKNDLQDIIFVGLENDEIKNRLINGGLRVSCYVRQKMDAAEISSAVRSNGFVYLQAKVPEDQVNPDFPTIKNCIEYLRKMGVDREIYCGVGIYTPEDFKMVMDAGADGAFVGSTVLKLYDQPEKLKETVRKFKIQR